MIPTVLFGGLVFGRWWKVIIPVAILGWPSLLIATGVDSGFRFAIGAALLAALNVMVGVLAYQALRLVAQFGKARHAR